MKLNIGCGHRRIDGFTGVDAAHGEAVDIVAEAHAIPLPDSSVDEIMAIHLFEHLYRWEVDGAIEEWKRLLKPGGLLVLELPDIIKVCENIISNFTQAGKHPDQAGLWGAYGDPRLKDPRMVHRWGWSPKTLRLFLKEHGFLEITDAETKFHPAGRVRRDMRIEARKP